MIGATQVESTPAEGSRKSGLFGWLVGFAAIIVIARDYLNDTAEPRGGVSGITRRRRRARRRR